MSSGQPSPSAPKNRLDKWLWYARVVKTRTKAQALVRQGKVRIDTIKTSSPSRPVQINEVLTITLERKIRILRVLHMATRRGSAPEAQLLYEDLTPPPVPRSSSLHSQKLHAARGEGEGRPTKKQRREMSAFRSQAGEEFQ